MKQFKRFLPIGVILVLMLLVYFSHITNYLSYESFKSHYISLKELVHTHPLLSPLLFMGIYMVVTLLSIPGAILFSLIGGFLFPQPWSTLYVVLGATVGASLLFLAAKTAFGESLKKRAGSLLSKMRAGFQKDAVSYLLFLRLVPLFPFFLVNLAAALFGVPLTTFIWTTCIGIIPGAFIFTQTGAGLDAILMSNQPLSIDVILNTKIKIALICLGLLALLPLVFKRYRNARHKP